MKYGNWLSFIRRTPQRNIIVGVLLALLVAFGLRLITRAPQTSAPTPSFIASSSLSSTLPIVVPSSSATSGIAQTPVSTPPISPFIPAAKPQVFYDPFNTPGTLYEAPTLASSSSPYWWVDSGAKFIIQNGIAGTVQGALPADDSWRKNYAASNPVDTDAGTHPQNIFRLVSKNTWQNMTEEAYFKINANNFSASSNRNESNGLLLFSRYGDGANLYYVGIRVDGAAVIKKKIGGVYYEMAYQKIFPGTYNAVSSPNLLPENVWMGIRETITNTPSHAVKILLYIDIGKTGNWLLVAQAVDDGTHFGGAPFLNAGHGGIRTDFMDVSFDDFKVTYQ